MLQPFHRAVEDVSWEPTITLLPSEEFVSNQPKTQSYFADVRECASTSKILYNIGIHTSSDIFLTLYVKYILPDIPKPWNQLTKDFLEANKEKLIALKLNYDEASITVGNEQF